MASLCKTLLWNGYVALRKAVSKYYVIKDVFSSPIRLCLQVNPLSFMIMNSTGKYRSVAKDL